MKKHLQDSLVIGFALFSMFFGAGNVIFPPYLGLESGPEWLAGFFSYFMADIGLALLAMFAILRQGSPDGITARIGRIPSTALMCAIVLCIGPMLAIPRTAATTYETSLAPLVSGFSPALFSILFFLLILLLCVRETAVVDIVGKILTPALLIGLLILIVVGVVNPIGPVGEQPLVENVAATGVEAGYQTMDAIAGLNFGIVIVLNIRALGVTQERPILRTTIRAGVIAAILFAVVYSMLAHIGALSSTAFPGTTNGAVTLTNVVGAIFGPVGSVLLAAVFIIACFNTCVGLISSCASYFNTLVPKLSIPAWAAFFAVVSMIIANAGLDQILAISVPILNILYPPAIVLIFLAFLPGRVQKLWAIYPVGIAFTTVASILYTLQDLKIPLFGLDALLKSIPLADVKLGWVLPAVVGILLGAVLSALRPRTAE